MAADVIEHYEAAPMPSNSSRMWPSTGTRASIWPPNPANMSSPPAKPRGKDEWYVGCTAGDNGYKTNLPLDFLTPGRNYTATLYMDAPGTAWNKRPEAYVIKK